MTSWIKQALKEHLKGQEKDFTRRGYYLVHSSGRYWVHDVINPYKLEQVCKRVLTDTDFEYWIDYSYGRDVDGNVAWKNLDCTGRFI